MTALGIGLMVIAALLIVAEAHAPTGGILGLFGLISLIAGSVILYDEHSAGFAVAAILVTLLISLPLAFVFARKTMKAQREQPVKTGWEELVGSEVEVREQLDPAGQVLADGALWRARLAEAGGPVPLGSKVRVESVDGLTLVVGPPAGSTQTETKGVG